MSRTNELIKTLDSDKPEDKPQYVSFRISPKDFKQMGAFAKFLHKRGLIKAPTYLFSAVDSLH
ncbi:MAG: hypothetical protein WCC17_26255 [Candidatus Nitrosopolaris sp.]